MDPDDWRSFDWHKQEAELRAIADLCRHSVAEGPAMAAEGAAGRHLSREDGRRSKKRKQKRLLTRNAALRRSTFILRR
jgi:hypothetical protein